MKALGLSLIVVAFSAANAFAAIGDQWILGINQLQNGTGPIVETIGAGYGGFHSSGNPAYFGNSYAHSGGGTPPSPGAGDITRYYWSLSGPAQESGRLVPTTMELYTIEYWGVAQPSGRNDFQVIESQVRGGGGADAGGIDSLIPWVGQFSTNHQWLRAPRDPVGSAPPQSIIQNAWNGTGDGSQAPESDDYNAEGSGIYMWLRRDSWVYAKWDFPFATNRAWSALRLTQITESSITGDHDGDEDVDIYDYVTWRATNINDENGYNDWRSNYGTGGGTGAGFAVPEPASVWLALGCILTMALAARRRISA